MSCDFDALSTASLYHSQKLLSTIALVQIALSKTKVEILMFSCQGSMVRIDFTT